MNPDYFEPRRHIPAPHRETESFDSMVARGIAGLEMLLTEAAGDEG